MTEASCRAYLLGTLPESEAALVEGQLLEDGDLFGQLQTAEDDLFDAFARGALDEEGRARFLERLGGDQRRMQFARAFVQRTIKPSPWTSLQGERE